MATTTTTTPKEPKTPADLKMPASTVPVELEDDLRVPAATLLVEPVFVEWSQSFGKKKSDTYYAVIFTNDSKNNDPGRLFISSGFVETFKATSKLSEDGTAYLFKVTDKYKYGQDSKGKNRFLVLHDPDNNVYQHRFATNKRIEIVNRVGEGITNTADRGKDEFKLGIELISAKFGDALNEFKPPKKEDPKKEEPKKK